MPAPEQGPQIFRPIDLTGGDPYDLGHGFGTPAGVVLGPDGLGGPVSARVGTGLLEPRNWRFEDLQQLTPLGVEDRRLAIQLVLDPDGDLRRGSAPFGQPEAWTPRNRSTRYIDAAGRIALGGSLFRHADTPDKRHVLALNQGALELGSSQALLLGASVDGKATGVILDSDGITAVAPAELRNGRIRTGRVKRAAPTEKGGDDAGGKKRAPAKGFGMRAGGEAEVARLRGRAVRLDADGGDENRDKAADLRRRADRMDAQRLEDEALLNFFFDPDPNLRFRVEAGGLEEARRLRALERRARGQGRGEDADSLGRRAARLEALGRRDQATLDFFSLGKSPGSFFQFISRSDRQGEVIDRLRRAKEEARQARRVGRVADARAAEADVRRLTQLLARVKRGVAGASAFGIKSTGRRLKAGISLLPKGVKPSDVKKITVIGTQAVIEYFPGKGPGPGQPVTLPGGLTYASVGDPRLKPGTLAFAGFKIDPVTGKEQFLFAKVGEGGRPVTGDVQEEDAICQIRPTIDRDALGYVWGPGAPPDGLPRIGLLETVFMPEAAIDTYFVGGEGNPIGPLPIRTDAQFAMGPVDPEDGARLIGRIRFVDADAAAIPSVGKVFKGEMWIDTTMAHVGDCLAKEIGQWVPTVRVDAEIPPCKPPPDGDDEEEDDEDDEEDEDEEDEDEEEEDDREPEKPDKPPKGRKADPPRKDELGWRGRPKLARALGAKRSLRGPSSGRTKPQRGQPTRSSKVSSADFVEIAGERELRVRQDPGGIFMPGSGARGMEPACAVPGPSTTKGLKIKGDGLPDLDLDTGAEIGHPAVVRNTDGDLTIVGRDGGGDYTIRASKVALGQRTDPGSQNILTWPTPIFGEQGGPEFLEDDLRFLQLQVDAMRRVMLGMLAGPGHLEANLAMVSRNRIGPAVGHQLHAHHVATDGELATGRAASTLCLRSISEAIEGSTLKQDAGGVLDLIREHRGGGTIQDSRPLISLENDRTRNKANIVGDLVSTTDHKTWVVSKDGDTTQAGDANVGGDSTVDGDLTVGGDTTVDGDTTLDGDVSIGSDLDVNGNGEFASITVDDVALTITVPCVLINGYHVPFDPNGAADGTEEDPQGGEFRIGLPDACAFDHWHREAKSLEGVSIPDPDPTGCGHGTKAQTADGVIPDEGTGDPNNALPEVGKLVSGPAYQEWKADTSLAIVT